MQRFDHTLVVFEATLLEAHLHIGALGVKRTLCEVVDFAIVVEGAAQQSRGLAPFFLGEQDGAVIFGGAGLSFRYSVFMAGLNAQDDSPAPAQRGPPTLHR